MHTSSYKNVRQYSTIALILAVLTITGGCATTGPVGTVDPDLQKAPWSSIGLAGREIQTEHFTIISTLTDTQLENAIPVVLESAFKRYEKTFASRAKIDTKLKVYIFTSRQEWLHFVRQNYPGGYPVYRKILSGGFSEGTTSVSFHTSRPGTLATLIHEGWHQYLAARTKQRVPAWLNEGFACYHEAAGFANKKPTFTPRHNTFRINSLRSALQRNELLPLKQIVSTDAGKVISQNHSITTQTYYAQAWALVTFLKHGKNGAHRAGLKKMLADIDDGTFQKRMGALNLTQGGQRANLGELAFKHYFGAAPEDMEKDYYSHLVHVCGF